MDILEIDAKIRETFLSEEKKLPEYKSRLEELNSLDISSLPDRVKIGVKENREKLERKVNDIISNREFNFYLLESTPLVDQYKKILNRPQKISFVGRACLNDSTNREKAEIIHKYLEVVQKYQKYFSVKKGGKKVKQPLEQKKPNICDNCGKTDFIAEESYMVCAACSTEKDIIESVTTYKDSDRINISTKYTYDKKTHFRDCINQYQGKQNCSIDQKVYSDLESALERHRLLNGGKETPKLERFSRVSREHVLMFLKELGYSKHYENVILIHHVLTGKKPDDISHLEDKLLQDFDVLVETYDKLFKNKIGRKSFLNCTNLLYQLLVKWKHPCKKEDFNVLKTVERKNFHDSICAELFKQLSWNYVPIS